MKIISVIVFFLILLTPVQAQKKRTIAAPKPTPGVVPVKKPGEESSKKTENKEIAVAPQAVYSDLSFDEKNLDWQEMPLSFLGNDFSKIFEILLASFKSKDEFETTEAYRNRIKAASERVLFGNLTPKSLMSFRYDDVSSLYDADRELLSVSVSTNILSSFNSLRLSSTLDKYKGIEIRPKIMKNLGTYEGQNAFNAKKEISKYESHYFLFALNNIREFKDYLNSDGYLSSDIIKVDLRLPVDKAREAKANLSYLVIVKLAQPFADSDISFIEPKFDSPIDATIYKQFLTGQLQELWLFNRSTGEIYKKIKAVPITSGELKITSPVRSGYIFLLDKSIGDILLESGLSPVDQTNAGIKYDLLATFIRGSRNIDSKKYKPFMDAIAPIIAKHVLKTISTDAYGSATIQNVAFRNYYIFSIANDYAGNYIWDLPFEIKDEESSVYLGSSNATYK